MKVIYTVENLDCPNCAAKIETAIQKLDCIESASLSYTTGTLHITAKSADGLLEAIQAASNRIENGVIFTPKKRGSAVRQQTNEQHHHEHGECCHEHHHEHGEHCHEHHHEHGEHCHEHHHEHHHEQEKTTKRLSSEHITLMIGTVLFAIGMILHFSLTDIPYISMALLLIAYLVMGAEVLLSSVKSIGKGQIFDENFLMSIATIGALCIGSWEEAAGVMFFFRLGELFEHLAVERSRQSVMEAIDMRPETVQLLRDGTDEPETVAAETIQPGDRILVRAGDRIPVDSIVLRGNGMVDTSAITGEPVPVSVKPNDSVMSGCINQSGVLELEATAALEDSMVQRILDSVENAAAGKPKIDRFITRFSRVYTPIVVAIAVITAIVPSLVTGNWSHWVYTALNFLMISCPCALVLSVPLAFFTGIGVGSTKGILFKDGLALEALARVKAVVMDKTGTLTKGSFEVTDVLAENPAQLLQYCAACESFSTHPIAKSILHYADAQHILVPTATDIQEIAGKGIIGTVDGKHIAVGNEKLMAEVGAVVAADKTNKMAGTIVHTAVDGQYLGALVLSDAPKPHATETVAAMNHRGLHTVMLTGDNPANAKQIAQTLQIAETHAGLLPTEKPLYMEKVRAAHGSVLFVGDGINDAPVLSGADVGAAMGSGADAAMEAADIVLLGSDPQSILTSLQIADRVNKTAMFCVIFALAIKIGIMLLGFLGFANMWLSVFADTGVTILCVLFALVNIRRLK
ncbi:MAG: cadmium-translocating P-type ATPase [Oscillospiraceae bacterium]|nr:cadmium-translocating P-type ATPase [Oscillospiraceae bacterium]